RLDEINRLKKKYGPTVNDMLDYMAKIEEELEQLTNKDSHLAELEEEIRELEQDAYLDAKQLHDIRKQAAEQLTREIHKELKGVYLDKATFSVSFDTKSSKSDTTNDVQLTKNGFDFVRFFIST